MWVEQPSRLSQRASRPLPPATSAFNYPARAMACTSCQWNVEWVCEHIGCQTCSGAQKRLRFQPLMDFLSNPQFHCPLNKF
jgi:hypothetical protein